MYGFGPDSAALSTEHAGPTTQDVVSIELLVHFAWNFLSPKDRQAVSQASLSFQYYHRLRVRAARGFSLAILKKNTPTPSATISHHKCMANAIALMRAHFVYADYFRWLGGVYNSKNRNFRDTFSLIDQTKSYSPPSGYPELDFDRTWRLFTEGAPLAGHFECSRQSVVARNMKNNFSGAQKESGVIMEKFVKEEKLCYHIFFPRIIWRFIPGVFLALINWVAPKPWRIADSGRLCIDPSSRISPTDDGNTNRWIPDTGIDHDQNPPVAYGTAFIRFLQYIYNFRIDEPHEDILLNADDISSAFRRVTYNPGIAIVFASIFTDYLIIPVGQIFGSKSSPSFYMLPGELRAHMARHIHHLWPSTNTALSDRIRLGPPPTPEQVQAFRPAVADSLNQGRQHLLQVNQQEVNLPVYSPFVDDTGTAGLRHTIQHIIKNSVLAAYLVFGFPDEDPLRPQPINPAKFIIDVLHTLKFLGFIINTRDLTVEWPTIKQHQLFIHLTKIINGHSLDGDRRRITPQQAAQILGLLRHSAVVSLMGIYLGLSLQYQLNDAIRLATIQGKSTCEGAFWKKHRFTCSAEAVADMKTLAALLPPALDTPARFPWIRPIGLIIPREATIINCGDASLEGMGGWTTGDHKFMWKLTAHELRAMGYTIPTTTQECKLVKHGLPTQEDDKDASLPMHINILEFVALIINFWFIVTCAIHANPNTLELIIRMRTDNSSALSWLQYAARSKRRVIRRLARMFQALLTCSPLPVQLQSDHIPGERNHNADLLSRQKLAKSWASVIALSSPSLETYQACQVPSELLSQILQIYRSDWIGAELVEAMTKLWTVELSILPGGPSEWDLHSNISNP